jgi:hypothetical protein
VNGRLLRLVASVLGLLWPAPALAWGDMGHRIICEIAFQELEPTARERVKAMIRRDPEFDTFAEACTCPTIHGAGLWSTTSTYPARPRGSPRTPAR